MTSFLKRLRILVCIGLIGLLNSLARAQQPGGDVPSATPMKEFITACTYGVLAGTLVGTATLAFEERPGDKLQKVARGASLGLYAGIMLGLYVIYIVPGQIEQENLEIYEQEGLPPPEDAMNRFHVFPLISQNGLDGAAATWKVMSF